ncbi:MAG TPA: hypothetical protein VFJ74_17355 [Gemmatimonadaceae bacterium]|nr:hypothetical protein [Gemmatimonadaceae bacterium]
MDRSGSAPHAPVADARDGSPPLRLRLALALALGVLGATLCFVWTKANPIPDFAFFHYAARVWRAGGDPYLQGFPLAAAPGRLARTEPYYYPLPAAIAIAPFASLPVAVAAACFVGISTALLAYALLRDGDRHLPAFAGAGFLVAAGLGQWSPLVLAASLLPALRWLVVVKPNLGVALTAARPTRVAVLGGAAVLLASVALMPSWPAEWRANVALLPRHPPPVLVPGGALALLALTRWRRPEARLLVAMACVPQLLFFADQLPLWTVPRSRRESMALSATSLVAWALALRAAAHAAPGTDAAAPAFAAAPYVLAGVYLPALVMVMRRPNEGDVPAWVERAVGRLRLRRAVAR